VGSVMRKTGTGSQAFEPRPNETALSMARSLSTVGLVGLTLIVGCSAFERTATDLPFQASELPPSGTLDLPPQNTTTPTQQGHPTPTSSVRPTTEVITPTFSHASLESGIGLGDDVVAAGLVALVGLSEDSLLDMRLVQTRSLRQDLGDFWEVLLDFSSSHDRSSMAFLRTVYDANGSLAAQELVITDALGVPRATFPTVDGFGSIIGWLQDGQLLVSLVDGPTDDVLLLDPESGKTEVFAHGLPDVYDNFPPPLWGFPVQYDPTLARALYLRDLFTEEGLGMILWDLEANEMLWQLDGTAAMSATPQWSPDGSQAAFAEPLDTLGYQYELSLIDRQGRVSRVTDLGSAYGLSVTIISSMRWSPDGRQIAIVVDLRENQYASETSETLLVANLAAGTLTEYVLPEGTADSFGFPLWSPDSRQLAIESWVDPNATQTLLIDLETELFVQVASNARPVAWLAPQH